MGEAEHRLEVAALHEHDLGDELVGVVAPPHVGPQEPVQAVGRGEAVAGGHRALGDGRQVDPVEVADEGEVGAGRGQRQPLGLVPRRVGRGDDAQLAVDLNRRHALLVLVDLEAHPHPERAQALVVLVATQVPEVPLVTSIGGAVGPAGDLLQVVRVGTGDGQPAEVDLAQVLGGEHRRGEGLAVAGAVGRPDRLERVTAHLRQSRLPGREHPVQEGLDLAEQQAGPFVLVGRDVLGHQDAGDGDPRVAILQRDRPHRPPRVGRHRDGLRGVGPELADHQPVPETSP